MTQIFATFFRQKLDEHARGAPTWNSQLCNIFRSPFAPKQDLFACCFLTCVIFLSFCFPCTHSATFPLNTTLTRLFRVTRHIPYSRSNAILPNFARFPPSLIFILFLPHLNTPIYCCRSKKARDVLVILAERRTFPPAITHRQPECHSRKNEYETITISRRRSAHKLITEASARFTRRRLDVRVCDSRHHHQPALEGFSVKKCKSGQTYEDLFCCFH